LLSFVISSLFNTASSAVLKGMYVVERFNTSPSTNKSLMQELTDFYLKFI